MFYPTVTGLRHIPTLTILYFQIAEKTTPILTKNLHLTILQQNVSREMQWETTKNERFSLQSFNYFKDEVGDKTVVLWLESSGKHKWTQMV